MCSRLAASDATPRLHWAAWPEPGGGAAPVFRCRVPAVEPVGFPGRGRADHPQSVQCSDERKGLLGVRAQPLRGTLPAGHGG